jgi:hypothetical protein
MTSTAHWGSDPPDCGTGVPSRVSSLAKRLSSAAAAAAPSARQRLRGSVVVESADQDGASMASIAAVAPEAETSVARLPKPSVLLAVALASCVAAGVSVALPLTHENVSGIQVALLEWISVPYIGAGLVAWWPA